MSVIKLLTQNGTMMVILIIYTVKCFLIPEFDFRDVIRMNKKYAPLPDRCHLRVYGGVTANPGDIPYQVAIRKKKGRVWAVFCGGAIVTEKHVVTAAHCFENVGSNFFNTTRVVAGTISSNINLFGNKNTRRTLLAELQTKETWREIAECYTHEHYSRTSVRNDFAVLVLDEPLEFSDRIKPIRMVQYHTKLLPDTPCTTSGYGLMEGTKPSPSLRYVCVPLVIFGKCKHFYPLLLRSSYTQICAGSRGKDSCQGDSGGPMSCKGLLVGLVSYGAKCGEAPGVYTLLSGYTKGNRIPLVKSSSVKINIDAIEITLLLFYINACGIS